MPKRFRKDSNAAFIIQLVRGGDPGGVFDESDRDPSESSDSDGAGCSERKDQNAAGSSDDADAPPRMLTRRAAAALRSRGREPLLAMDGSPTRRRGSRRNNVAFEGYSSDEAAFYASCSRDLKRRIDALENRMQSINAAHVPMRFKVLLSEVDEKVKAAAMKRVDALANLDDSSPEYYKILTWIDALCCLPVGKYCHLPVGVASSADDKRLFLADARMQLDKTVYGHAQAKEQILRLMAQWITNPQSKGMVLGIHGCHGCGKTTLVKEGICRVLGLPFALMPLGGASDGSYLEGHSYTYEGSTWGKIVDVMMKCKCSNPVLYFDELDKVSESHRGEEIVNKLIHLTDASQNSCYMDKYFYDVELDLSRCLIIFSYNHEEKVNPILLDRMVRIRTDGYGLRDKQRLAQGYLLPELLSEFCLVRDDVVVSDDVLAYIVEYIEPEAGVRNLKRALHEILSSLNLLRLTDPERVQLPVTIARDHVHAFVKTALKASMLAHAHMYS